MSISQLLPDLTMEKYILDRPPGKPITNMFFSGDSRVNENAAIQTLHILFAREHNRKARELSSNNPSWDDDSIFFNSRKWIIGIWQKFVFESFIPQIIENPMPEYSGFKPFVDPSIDVNFMAAAFQFPKTGYPAFFTLYEKEGTLSPQNPILYSDTHYSNEIINEIGIEPFLRGIVATSHLKIGFQVSAELRRTTFNNTVFYDPLAEALLLGRDAGVASYLHACSRFAVDTYENFEALASISLDFSYFLAELNNNSMENIELLVGGLIQKAKYPNLLSPLFNEMALEQFTRLRDGDRFYFRSTTSGYSDQDVIDISNFGFDDLVILNTMIKNFPSNPFQLVNPAKAFQNISENNESIHDASSSKMAETSLIVSDHYSFNWTVLKTIAGDPYIKFELIVTPDPLYNNSWFGIGFGTSMQFSDLIVLSICDSGPFFMDCWSQDYDVSQDSDLSPNSFSNIYDEAELETIDPFTRRFQFSRLLNTSDLYDYPIVLMQETNVLWAYSRREQFPSFHGSVRNSKKITFFDSIEAYVAKTTADNVALFPDQLELNSVKTGMGKFYNYIHGGIMLLLFMGLIPVSVFMSRYMTEHPSWLEVHEKFTTCCVSQFAAAMVLSFSTTEIYSGGDHAKLGVGIVVLIFVAVLMGYLMRYAVEFMEMHPTVAKYLRMSHGIVGYAIFGIGQYECLTGMIDLFGESFQYPIFLILYGMWVLMLMTGITIGEYHIFLQHVLPYNPVAKAQYKAEMKKKYAHLPEFTWKDISERVLKGSLWVLIDRVLYNVAEFAHFHPGGPHFLFQAIGTDSSSLFDASIKDFEMISQTKDNDKGDKSVASVGRSSVAYSIEQDDQGGENISDEGKYRLEKNLKIHSRLAKLKMELLAVGTLAAEDVDPEMEHVNLKIQKDMFPRVSCPGIWPYQANILTISSKKQISGADARTCVINLKLKFLSEMNIAHFFPGDHVVLQHISKTGKILTRSYTPIKQLAQHELSFIIKLYPDGEFCRLINHLSEGENLIARGPLPGTNNLFNEHDNFGCYQAVGMIVAGTGLSPALLLIDHYIRYGPRDVNEVLTTQLSLLFVNSTEDDIFFRKELEDLAIDCRGALKLFFCVRDCTSEWKGYTGIISEEMVRESMPPPNFKGSTKSDLGSRNTLNMGVAGNLSSSAPRNSSAVVSKGFGSRILFFGADNATGGGTPSAIPRGRMSATTTSITSGKDDNRSLGSKVGLTIGENIPIDQLKVVAQNSRVGSTAIGMGRKTGGSVSSSSKRRPMTLFSEEESPFKVMVCGSLGFNSSVAMVLNKIGYKKHQLEILGGETTKN